MRTKLVEAQAGAKAAVIDATETLQYQLTQLRMQDGQLASLSTGLDVIARDSEKAVQSFLSEDAQKLSDAERRVEDASQRLAKAQATVDHLTLRAPIAGRVQSSVIVNVGQVVTSGQEIMRVVPEDSKLEIEAYVLNRDIGFVHVGQEAVVKVEVLPVHPLWIDQGAGDADRQGRDSLARRQRHRRRPCASPERQRLRRRRTDAKSGIRRGPRAGNLVDPGRRRRSTADLGNGGHGRAQDGRPSFDRICLLAARRGGFAGDARAVGVAPPAGAALIQHDTPRNEGRLSKARQVSHAPEKNHPISGGSVAMESLQRRRPDRRRHRQRRRRNLVAQADKARRRASGDERTHGDYALPLAARPWDSASQE